MKTGVIDVGGGMRGIYGAGVFDCCLKHGIHFDYCIGISAGSANLASFLGGQERRNYRFFHDYSFRKEYMSLSSLIHTGSFLSLEYIYGTLSNSDGEDPLDFKRLCDDPATFQIIAANAETGEKKVFDKSDMAQDDYRVLMASSCVPVAAHPIGINGVRYFDGALADPVPVKQAFEAGCDRVVLILTKPVQFARTQGKDKLLAKMIRRRYPISAANMLKRAERYNAGVALAQKYEAQGKVLIVAPDDTCGIDTLKCDPAAFDALYQKGLHDGLAIDKWLSE